MTARTAHMTRNPPRNPIANTTKSAGATAHIRANTAIRKTNDIASAAIPLPTVGRMHFFRASKTTVNMGMKPATPIPIPATRTPMSLESTIDRLSTAQS